VLYVALLMTGCGGRPIYPVHGQLVDRQGKSLTGLKGGRVVFDNKEAKSSAVGVIEADGTFQLTTLRPGDGAFVGKNLVSISRPYVTVDQRAPYAIDPTYDSFATSGLEVTVEPKANEVRLTVERVRGSVAKKAGKETGLPGAPAGTP
jgi:hypothetical protein